MLHTRSTNSAPWLILGLKFGDDAQLDEAIEKVLSRQVDRWALSKAWSIFPKLSAGIIKTCGPGSSATPPPCCMRYFLLDWRMIPGYSKQWNTCQPGRRKRLALRLRPELGKFHGPGRKDDPCPIANVYAFKALSLADPAQSPDVTSRQRPPIWLYAKALRCCCTIGNTRRDRKIYMFGIGTDFRKLKYPYVWYNILHVVEVLSRFPEVSQRSPLPGNGAPITEQADEQGRYTANSMYMAWKGWSFANKKEPSPWLTFLVLRIQQQGSVPL